MADDVEYLSMPDPCPHVSRMELIGAKLNGGGELEGVLEHLAQCASDADDAATRTQCGACGQFTYADEKPHLCDLDDTGPMGATMHDAWEAWGYLPGAGET